VIGCRKSECYDWAIHNHRTITKLQALGWKFHYVSSEQDLRGIRDIDEVILAAGLRGFQERELCMLMERVVMQSKQVSQARNFAASHLRAVSEAEQMPKFGGSDWMKAVEEGRARYREKQKWRGVWENEWDSRYSYDPGKDRRDDASDHESICITLTSLEMANDPDGSRARYMEAVGVAEARWGSTEATIERMFDEDRTLITLRPRRGTAADAPRGASGQQQLKIDEAEEAAKRIARDVAAYLK
jgi:hypothetical protein